MRDDKAMKDYLIQIFYSEEDEGYVADVPDLRRVAGVSLRDPGPGPVHRGLTA